jgi:transposase
VNREQQFLLPVDMKEWLPQDDFSHFVIEFVGQLDLTDFLAAYRPDGKGGAAYDPAMMVALFLYAYFDGERSSRRIEKHCHTDIAYRFVAGFLTPDHSTIARFRQQHEEAFIKIFVQALRVCLNAGMGDLSLAAIDGSKFRCPASLRANRTLANIEKRMTRLTDEIEAELERIAKEILADANRADLEDDALDGTPAPPPREPGTLPDVPGLPKKLHGKAAALARLARAKKVLDDENKQERADYDQHMAERAEKEAATGKKIPGRKPKQPKPDPRKKVNVTDLESRVMKNAHGTYLQGYNAQAAATPDRLNLAADVVNDENDFQLLHPMMKSIDDNVAAAAPGKKVGTRVTDSGYCTDEAMAAIDPEGPPVLMATGKDREARRRAAEEPTNEGPPPDGLTLREEMDWKLGTAEGKETYRRRAATIEPTFGQNKHNRNFTVFLRTGLVAADSEWKIMNTVDNAARLFRRVLSGDVAPPAWARVAHILGPPRPA